jgi:hypothetical protein
VVNNLPSFGYGCGAQGLTDVFFRGHQRVETGDEELGKQKGRDTLVPALNPTD